MKPTECLRRAVLFYVEGFRSMTWGRVLWVIILAKLFVFFVVLRLFFFRPALAGLTDEQKGSAVAGQLLSRPAPPDAATETSTP